jgi:hypothetical protein
VFLGVNGVNDCPTGTLNYPVQPSVSRGYVARISESLWVIDDILIAVPIDECAFANLNV